MNIKVFLQRNGAVLFILLLLTTHSFLMNGYYTNHRQLTVATYFSSIRAEIDPSLFQNSGYVQAVNRTNLRIALFYDLVPHILEYIDLETYAIFQTFISLFFMLSGIYALTYTMFGSSRAGYLATLLYSIEINNWTLGSPAPYLNFFHHGLPFTYPLIVWSMFFFLKKRFPLAFFLAGTAWAFHIMCAFFLVWAYAVYWIFNFKQFKLKTTLICGISFGLPALPYLFKAIKHMGSSSASGPLWQEGVRWVAWYSCFPATWPLFSILKAGLFFVLTLVCILKIRKLAVINTIMPFFLSVALLCLIGIIFTDFYPIPIVIKFSLWRSTIIYLFLAISCIGYVLTKLNDHITQRFLAIALIVIISGYLDNFKLYYFPFLILLLTLVLWEKPITARIKFLKTNFKFLLIIIFAGLFSYQLFSDKSALSMGIFFLSTLLFLLTTRTVLSKIKPSLRNNASMVMALLFLCAFDFAVLYSNGGPDIYYQGKKMGKMDLWTDIQIAAKKHSGKDDLFIVPPYIPGFTNYSLRATLGDWAEGSTLLYLDNQYTQEWFERMNDLGWTKPNNSEKGFNELSTKAIIKAARKYGARFVVTEKPKTFSLPTVYENNKYILYQIF